MNYLTCLFKNPEQAKIVVERIEKVIDDKIETQTDRFEQIIQKDIANLRTELKTDYVKLGATLETKIAESKTDMVKWVMAFFVTLAFMIIGLYFKK